MRQLCSPVSRSAIFFRAAKWSRLFQIALAFLICFSTPRSQAQYRFDPWTTDNGLPQNSVRNIAQTPDGYLWLATYDGLVRFDGMRFTVFDRSHAKGITSNRFTALYVDDGGALWAGTEDSGLVVYRDGLFTPYTTSDQFRQVSEVFDIRPDPEGNPLVTTPDGPLYLRGGGLTAAPPHYDSPDTRFYLSPSGTLWALDRDGVKQSKDGRVIQYRIKLDFSHDLYSHITFYEDRQGSLWFGDYGSLYKLRDGAVTRYLPNKGLPTLPAFTVLRPYCEDDDGGLWLAVGRRNQNTSLGVMRLKDGRFTLYGKGEGLLENIVNHIFKDREGTIWIGTPGGLNCIRKQVIAAYSTESGLLNKETYPLLETNDGAVLVGTIQGLSQFKDGKFSTLMGGGSFHSVLSLWKEPTGRLWIGAVGYLFWYENGKLTIQDSIKAGTNIWAIRNDRRGDVWVATSDGLFKFSDGRLTARYTTEDGLPGNDVKVIHQSSDSTLWFGVYGGLAKLQDGRFISYTTEDGLTGNHVRSIYEDSEGALWIGTYDEGLSRFQDGRFVNYRVEDGLFNNGVFQILEDRHGRFWISSNRGVYCVNKGQLNDLADGRVKEVQCVAYGKADGMLNIECNGGRQPAGIKSRDGKLWFPTMDGVVVINPDAVGLIDAPPPVVIERVSLDRREVDVSEELVIEPGQDDLEIGYTALSFIKPEQLKFKYRLEGINQEWTQAGTRRVAYYPYLPPGSYTFQVIAANKDGVWNQSGARLKIRVLAPFYLRWWFLLLSGSALAAAALLIFRTRVVELKKKQAAQEAFSRQLIESQEAERKRIATELHDSLGQSLLIIKNWALVALSSVADENPAREHLSEISDTTSQALDEVREIAHNLRPYQLERLGLTNTVEYMMRHVESSCDIEFFTEIDNVDGMISKESEINLYRIVQECVNNIVKHSEATRGWVIIKRDERGAYITCRDNGKGFDVEASAVSANGGLGLTGLAERVRMLGGSLSKQSAPGKGTTISVSIKL